MHHSIWRVEAPLSMHDSVAIKRGKVVYITNKAGWNAKDMSTALLPSECEVMYGTKRIGSTATI